MSAAAIHPPVEALRPKFASPDSLGRLVRRSAWAVADQGAFAVSNFVLSFSLARSLPPAEYGRFGAAFSIFLFVGAIHTALVSEPLLVYGSGTYRSAMRRYLGFIVALHGCFALAVAAAVLAGAPLWPVFGATPGLACAFSAACASTFILWALRRGCYVLRRPEWSLQAGALYAVVVAVCLICGERFGAISGTGAFGIMALASGAAAAWLAARLKIQFRLPDGSLPAPFQLHLAYGRWSLGTMLLTWLPGNLPFVLLPAVGGFEDVACLKAALNFLMPLQQGMEALAPVLTPVLVSARGTPRFRKLTRTVLLAFVGTAAVYWLLLLAGGGRASAFLYGGKYPQTATILIALGLVPVAGAVTAVMGSALRAMERPQCIFKAYLLTCAVSAVFGTSLILTSKLWGAVAATLFSAAITGIGLCRQFARLKHG